MKHLCSHDKCYQLAVWMYMPSGGRDDNRFSCEDHIKRGCSCMLDDDGNPYKDDQGRELPCCEYDYNEKGYNVYKD